MSKLTFRDSLLRKLQKLLAMVTCHFCLFLCKIFWFLVDNDIDLQLLQRCFVDEPLVCFFSNVFKYLVFFKRRRLHSTDQPSVDPFNHEFGWRIEPEKIRMYLPETNSKNAWKWMVGRRSSPLGIADFHRANYEFQGVHKIYLLKAGLYSLRYRVIFVNPWQICTSNITLGFHHH